MMYSVNPAHYSLNYRSEQAFFSSIHDLTAANHAPVAHKHYMNCGIPLDSISSANPSTIDPTSTISHPLDQHNAVSSAQPGFPTPSFDECLMAYHGQPEISLPPGDLQEAMDPIWSSHSTPIDPYLRASPLQSVNHPSTPSYLYPTMFPGAMSSMSSLDLQPTSPLTVGPYQSTKQRALQPQHTELYHAGSTPRYPSRYGQQRVFAASGTIPSSTLPYLSDHSPTCHAGAGRTADLDPIPAGHSFDVHSPSLFAHSPSFTRSSNAGPPSGPPPPPIQRTSSDASKVTQRKSLFCRWEGCTYVGPLDRLAIMDLRRHHVPRDHTSANVVDSVQCKWAGCRLQDAVKAKNLLKHLTGTHLRLKEVQCCGCKRRFSRPDSLKRHQGTCTQWLRLTANFIKSSDVALSQSHC